MNFTQNAKIAFDQQRKCVWPSNEIPLRKEFHCCSALEMACTFLVRLSSFEIVHLCCIVDHTKKKCSDTNSFSISWMERTIYWIETKSYEWLRSIHKYRLWEKSKRQEWNESKRRKKKKKKEKQLSDSKQLVNWPKDDVITNAMKKFIRKNEQKISRFGS